MGEPVLQCVSVEQFHGFGKNSYDNYPIMVLVVPYYYTSSLLPVDNFTISWINWFEGLPQIIGDFSDYIKAT